MKKKNSKKNKRKVSKKENGLKQKILEINLSKATIITSIIVIIAIALITAGIIRTINESNKEKVEVEQEEYSPVNWIESTEVGEDGNYKKVPVPKGYVSSQIEGETTVNGGFVIYEDNYNGKSINWDEIIIKDASSGSENISASGASVVNEEDDKKEEGINSEMPKTSGITPSENEPAEETATFPENMPSEEEQLEQEEITRNDENVDSEEKSEEENETKLEESTVSDEPVLNESEVAPQADGETEGEEIDQTEPETPTAEQQTKKNIFELQKNVNQYVWVPVPDINRICGVDANGKLWGKLYEFTWSGATPLNWTETEEKMNLTNKTGSYREPDVTHYNTSYDIDTDMKRYMYGETQYEMLAKEMEENFYEAMKSIEKYGGYYIGRYETGIEGRTTDNNKNGETVVRKMNTSISNVDWYQMYKGCKGLAGSNENVKTSMIWGSLWDETLKWLVESGAKTTGKEGVASQPITYSLLKDSRTWGNYRDATFKYIPVELEEPEATAEKASYTSIRIPTGSTEYTKANNIYDMAGNVYDWTLEAVSTYNRVLRGGSFNISLPACFRDSTTPDNSSYGYGCRAALIISDVS